jgi:hypothetical protein
MATSTSRLNATKPASSENVSITTLNDNFDLFDAAVGATAASASAKPASAFAGRLWYETDTGYLKVNTAASASVAATWRRPRQDGVVWVEDYFSAGRTAGVTDDSAAVIAAREAVMDSRTGSIPSLPILRFPPGDCVVTQPDALLYVDETQIDGYTIEGAGPYVSRVLFRPVGGSSTLLNMNLMTAGDASTPKLAGLRIRNICFDSDNANASFAYFFSDDSSWVQDTRLDDVRFSGTWKRIFGLDGDANANLNSEMTFNRVQTTAATFSDAFLHSGLTTPGSFADQDLFLNYWFYDCKFEQASGNTLIFDKGGHIIVVGGSWIIGDSGSGTHFKMGDYTHYDSVQFLKVTGARFELRNQNSRVIDCAWRGGHVVFDNIDDESHGDLYALNALGTGASANWDTHVYRVSTASAGPTVCYSDSALMGYHRVVTGGSQPSPGKWVYMRNNFRNMQGGAASATSSTGGQFLRYDSAIPKYRFQDNLFTTDANV